MYLLYLSLQHCPNKCCFHSKCGKSIYFNTGIGTFESQTGIYIGEWRQGLQNGNGTALYNNGNRYIGQFQDGFKHGIGKFQVNTIGDVYEGEFRNGFRYGQVKTN